MTGVISLLDQPRTLDALARPTSATIAFYLTGTTTLANIYSNPELTVPATNPVTLSSGQLFPEIFLDPTVVYRRKITYGDGSIHDIDPLTQDVLSSLSVSAGAGLVGYSTSTTYANGTVGAHLKNFITVKDAPFNAVGDGVVDDTAAIQAALNLGGTIWFPTGTYRITGTLNVGSNTQLIGEKGATIQTSVVDISFVYGTAVNNVVVENLKFKQTAAGTTAYTGGVELLNSTDCRVEACLFDGMQWAGVFLDGCTRVSVRDNYFTNFLGTIQDSADISIQNVTTICTISDNFCYGGGCHGILIQDPYAGLVPSRNVVTGNRIGQHTCYGIAVYLPGPGGSGDSFNQLSNNYIENIQGSATFNRSAGAGIYVVGAWSGGTQVTGNTITNCCVQTLDRALTPAGIGINGISASSAKVIISNNTITNMTQGDGIHVASSPGGGIVSNNAVILPTTNNGTGVGGGTLAGSGIYVTASSKMDVSNNSAIVLGTGSALNIEANGINISDISVEGGYYQTASAACVRCYPTGGFTIGNLSIAGTTAKNLGSSNYGFSLNAVSSGSFVGNTGTAVAFEALLINACTNLRVTGGSYTSGTTPFVSLTGTCTGTYIDASTYLGTASANIANGSTGGNIAWRASAVPAAGTWRQGDRVQNTVFTVGQPKAWACTVNGVPGTWVSEGNL